MAYQSFGAYWDKTNVQATIVESQASLIGIGGEFLGVGVNQRDWIGLSNDLQRLANAAPTPSLPDPYRTLIANFTAAIPPFKSAVDAVNTVWLSGDYVAADKAADRSATPYNALEQTIEAMRSRRQGGPIAIVP